MKMIWLVVLTLFASSALAADAEWPGISVNDLTGDSGSDKTGFVLFPEGDGSVDLMGDLGDGTVIVQKLRADSVTPTKVVSFLDADLPQSITLELGSGFYVYVTITGETTAALDVEIHPARVLELGRWRYRFDGQDPPEP